MANSTISAPPKAAGFPSRVFHLLSKVTWYELLAVPIIAVVAAIFWFKEAITEAFWTAQERTTSSLGLGMMPLGLWAGVFIAVLMIKPSIFRHYRYWLASALFVLLSMGVLSLFRPLDGPLAWFTLDGYVSLGGTIGEAIAGPVLWQQILRLGALAIVAVAVLSPAFAVLLAIATGRMVAYGCIGIMLISRGIGSKLRRKQKDPDTGSDLSGSAAPADEDDASGYTSPVTGTEIEDANDYSQRSSSRFARATTTAPLSIESTLSESADDRASPIATLADHSVAEIREREETDMQANTDFDFGFSHAPFGTALADVGNEERDLEPDDLNGFPSASDDTDESFDTGIDSQSIEDLMDAPAAPDFQDDSGLSGLTVRLLGKNREQWAKPSIEMLESVQDRGVPEDQIRETAETIRQTLADYDIEVEIGNIKYGPTVTMYGIIPGWTRRFKQVKPRRRSSGNPHPETSAASKSARAKSRKPASKSAAIL